MQSSTSFEHARTGRKRPSNLVAGGASAFEGSLSSPSFNVEHAINAMPSREGHYGPRNAASLFSSSKQSIAGTTSLAVPSVGSHGSLPPTPISAGLPLEDAPASQNAVKLPGIDQLLAVNPVREHLLTPPTSGRVPMGPRLGCEDDIAQFEGPPPQWIQDAQDSTFTDSRQILPPLRQGPTAPSPVPAISPREYQSIVRPETEQKIIGVGVASDDVLTPRIGSFGNNALGLYMAATPTQAQVSGGVLGAPSIEQQEEGSFPDTIPSSPISPPLRGWNTDLNFPDVIFSEPSPRLTSVPMEREHPVVFEGQMPSQIGLRGLGISLDGDDLEVYDHGGASTSRSCIVEPPTPTASSPRDTMSVIIPSTGLTPTLSSARIIDLPQQARPHSPSATASASPSLRSKSKKRSDLVRKEAEAAVAAREHTRSSLSPPSRSSQYSDSPRLSPLSQGLSDSQPSPRKRSLGDVDAPDTDTSTPSQKSKSSSVKGKASSSPTAAPSSPWGVFRLKEEGWKPLGPPGGGKGLAVSAVRGNTASRPGTVPKTVTTVASAPTNKKQKRTGPSVAPTKSLASASRPVSRAQDNKENIPPVSAAPRSISASRRGDEHTSLVSGGKFRRSSSVGRSNEGDRDVFGSEGPLATSTKRGSISGTSSTNLGAPRSTSLSRSIRASDSGAAPASRRRL